MHYRKLCAQRRFNNAIERTQNKAAGGSVCWESEVTAVAGYET